MSSEAKMLNHNPETIVKQLRKSLSPQPLPRPVSFLVPAHKVTCDGTFRLH